jgi:hypothetical protein
LSGCNSQRQDEKKIDTNQLLRFPHVHAPHVSNCEFKVLLLRVILKCGPGPSPPVDKTLYYYG